MKHLSRLSKQQVTGFTLVEILIAMTLFSFTLVLIFSALYSTSRTWQISNRQIDTNDEQRLELAFIRKQISQAIPLNLIDGKENQLLFKGETDAIHFTSSLPAHRGGGGLYFLSLLMSGNNAHQDLTLHYQPVRPDSDLFNNPDSEEVQTMSLIKNIEDVEFFYYGNQANDDEPRWYSQWDIKDKLPELVKVQITSVDNKQYWPALVIPVYSQAQKGQPQLTMHIPK
ncbi:MAG: prepilin-type N-terminal cleavage/methylation domain-containing protein [Proteobacteria bacterium]|nr:prepilin-type N-terminal cleavage/methylation domain-containing protein [Pseudomonadota bacterium]